MPGGVVFSLCPHNDLAEDMNAAGDNNGAFLYRGFALAHNVRSKEEVDLIFSQLKNDGATIMKEPQELFWCGYSGYVADPDGHSWEVVYNPHWTIQKDGRISLTKD